MMHAKLIGFAERYELPKVARQELTALVAEIVVTSMRHVREVLKNTLADTTTHDLQGPLIDAFERTIQTQAPSPDALSSGSPSPDEPSIAQVDADARAATVNTDMVSLHTDAALSVIDDLTILGDERSRYKDLGVRV